MGSPTHDVQHLATSKEVLNATHKAAGWGGLVRIGGTGPQASRVPRQGPLFETLLKVPHLETPYELCERLGRVCFHLEKQVLPSPDLGRVDISMPGLTLQTAKILKAVERQVACLDARDRQRKRIITSPGWTHPDLLAVDIEIMKEMYSIFTSNLSNLRNAVSMTDYIGTVLAMRQSWDKRVVEHRETPGYYRGVYAA